jgi:site-specific DNA-methyltransferase (adenine-specific)
MAEFARFGDAGGGGQNRKTHGRINGMFAMPSGTASYKEDTGSAARFFPTFPLSSDERMFYSAKAGKDDRLSSKHCTVKPVALIRWLCRLITPPNGTILDPFAGSGTTGSAALAEGFRCVLIEKEAEHYRDILDRLAHIKGDDTPLFAKPKAQAGLFD